MANMSYCRFRNTSQDLQDCIHNFTTEKLSSEEEIARMDLVQQCYTILEKIGVQIETEPHELENLLMIHEDQTLEIDEEDEEGGNDFHDFLNDRLKQRIETGLTGHLML